MNTETRKTMFSGGHPDENQLLLALERELSLEETGEVEQHLGNCWSCRARSSEMQSGILAFVEYREKRYLPSLEPPPQDFGGFPGRLGRIAAEGKPDGLAIRIWQSIRRFVTSSNQTWSNQVTWVSATAAILVAVIFWTQVLFNPSTVSASEFLARATAAQNPGARQKNQVSEKYQVGRTAHQRVRITNGQQNVLREFEWTVGSPIPQARWQVKEEPSEWSAPFTADGFAAWRDSVSTRKDKVQRSGDRWTLDTTALGDLFKNDDPVVGDVIKEAWLVVRASDFHPLEQHIRFADDRQLDFEELAFEISTPQRPDSESVAPARIAPNAIAPDSPAKTSEIASEPAMDPNETELALRYAMFANKWDLGEDLLIARTPRGVVVSGTASSGDLAASMQSTLSGLPNVQISITAPVAVDLSAASNRSVPEKPAQTASVPLLKDALDRAFTSPEQRREFVDRCLAASDTELSHAWALKKLVDRYSEAEERLLKTESQDKLREMLRTHLQELANANAGLDPLVELLPGSRVQKAEVPGNWRAGILALFAQVQQQDSLVPSLVAGTQANGQDTPAASGSLRSVHQSIGALLAGLNNMEVGSQRK
jgi:hypothetical protein